MLNQKMIDALSARGFKRWTKGNMDRLYINPTDALDFEYDTNKSGSISGASLNGETISNSRARELVASKTYIDVATGEIVSNHELMREAVEQIFSEVQQAAESAETTEATEATESAESVTADMTGAQINDAIADARYILRGDGLCPSTATEAEREAALIRLHDLRLEMWRRGNQTPNAAEADAYRARVARCERRLAQAMERGDIDQIYASRELLDTANDKLAYINA